ncbi:MAG: 2,3-bisphosphoglycerate-independent phosphoglycerate mutase [Pseudomonadales bacterium]
MSTAPTTTLIVLDGFGHRSDPTDNAVAQAATPFLDETYAQSAHTLISGSGLDVGLPSGQMGNSEVGHMNLGAGRVVHQDFTRINQAIEDQSFFSNPVLVNGFDDLAKTGCTLHVLGLLSPGGVHSHEDHLNAVVSLAAERGIKKIEIHGFLDGRDVPPKSAAASITQLEAHCEEIGIGRLATLCGRYFAMDRDQRWERTKQAFDLIYEGQAPNRFESAHAALEAAYQRGETDEFVVPTVIGTDQTAVGVRKGDQIIFINFRSDRARAISEAFTQAHFDKFERPECPALSRFVTFTQYSDTLNVPCAFPPEVIHNGLGEYLAQLGLRQLRIAETEKYAHVTFFFSCGREAPYPLEDRILIPSPDVATYDLAPEMSAQAVTDQLCKAIRSGDYAFIVCNFANGDMVGHTGNLSAAIKAVETLDSCLRQVAEATEDSGGQMLITADHGNCEQMSDPSTGQPHTAHTSEEVPLIYMGSKEVAFKDGGVLSDIAPTVLALMDLPQPKDMLGRSLISNLKRPST